VLNPPYGTLTANLPTLEAAYDATPNAKYFVVPGEQHVLWGDVGVVLPDGGVSAPRRSRDGGASLRDFIDGWATGDDAGWVSAQ
jgi:hypothetical protein